jgi:hypothetical protein
MTSRTLREILNSVLGGTSFLPRDAFATSTDPDNVQMMEYANEAARVFTDYCPWTRLRKTVSLPLTTDLIYDLPSDFGYYVPETMWRHLGVRRVNIPVTDDLWGYLKAGNPTTTVLYHAKFLDGKLEFYQVQEGDVINYDYIANTAIIDENENPKQRFTADTDKFLMDEQTLIYGIRGLWKQGKGIETAQADLDRFQRHLNESIARDVGAKTIRSRTRDREGIISPLSSQYAW